MRRESIPPSPASSPPSFARPGEGATVREAARAELLAARSDAVAKRYAANKKDYPNSGRMGRSDFVSLDAVAHSAEAKWRQASERFNELERNSRLAYVAAGAAELRASRAAQTALLAKMATHPMGSLRY